MYLFLWCRTRYSNESYIISCFCCYNNLKCYWETTMKFYQVGCIFSEVSDVVLENLKAVLQDAILNGIQVYNSIWVVYFSIRIVWVAESWKNLTALYHKGSFKMIRKMKAFFLKSYQIVNLIRLISVKLSGLYNCFLILSSMDLNLFFPVFLTVYLHGDWQKTKCE